MTIKGREVVFEHKKQLFHCPMDLTMDYIGGKWKTVVLWYLASKTRRYSELKKLIPGITEKMLSLQLKELENNGLIAKKSYAQVPPKTEYSLTPEGETLKPLLNAMSAWGMKRATPKEVKNNL